MAVTRTSVVATADICWWPRWPSSSPSSSTSTSSLRQELPRGRAHHRRRRLRVLRLRGQAPRHRLRQARRGRHRRAAQGSRQVRSFVGSVVGGWAQRRVAAGRGRRRRRGETGAWWPGEGGGGVGRDGAWRRPREGRGGVRRDGVTDSGSILAILWFLFFFIMDKKGPIWIVFREWIEEPLVRPAPPPSIWINGKPTALPVFLPPPCLNNQF